MSDWRDYKSLSIDGDTKNLHGWRAYAQEQLQEGYGIAAIEDILEFVVEWSNRKEWVEARTSGSTGRPKKIKIQKEHIVASALRTLGFLDLKPGNSALLCMPNRFIGGKMMIARSIIGELDLHIAESAATPEIPEGKTIDFAAVVPYQMRNILADETATEQWKGVRKIIIGGGQVDPALDEELKKWPNDIYESFGMTETISHVALRKITGASEREPFRLLDGIEVTQDDRGCMMLHSELLPENPLITNDIVEMVGEDAFHWMGRADNMINSGGVKIIPEVIEKLAKPLMHTKFFFAGLPDEKLGEKVALILESEPMSPEDQKELLRDLSQELHKYELPKEIHFVGAFEETDNGKVNRKKTLKLLNAN